MTVAVPSAEECRALFGAKMYRKNVQPVWVKIENRGDHSYLLFPISLDPDYFSPMETAWRTGTAYSNKGKTRLGHHLDELQTQMHIAPGQTVSGFVNTNLGNGTREVFLELIGDERIINFSFTVVVPGIKADHQATGLEEEASAKNTDLQSKIDLRRTIENIPQFTVVVPGTKADHLAAGLEAPASAKKTDLQNENDLQRAIEELPQFTSNKNGSKQGDPLNLIIIGDAAELWPPFIRQNWDETETLTWRTTCKTIRAYIFKRDYRHSPISPLYVFDRPQDVALQKIRDSLHARNHLRLWRTQLLYRGAQVWIGQISRDIGVRLTLKSPTIATHKIDPDIDEARFYLFQDLVYSQGLARVAYAGGSVKSEAKQPRKNLTGDPFYTDGLRLVLFLATEPMARDEIDYLKWEDPSQR